jgi:hypothetical protein
MPSAAIAFRQRRVETLETFGKLASTQSEKGGTHPVNGRITLDGFLSVLAWHDDNHLDQLTRRATGPGVTDREYPQAVLRSARRVAVYELLGSVGRLTRMNGLSRQVGLFQAAHDT